MGTGPGLLVVSEEDDEAGLRLSALAAKCGIAVLATDYSGASLVLEVRHDSSGVAVKPSCPMVLRAPPRVPADARGSASFHAAEIRAIVWAAGALTPARVMNRPGPWGFSGRACWSRAVLRRRAGLHSPSVEVFAGTAVDASTKPGTSEVPIGRSNGTIVFCVVGDDVVPLGDAADGRLAAASSRVARRLGLAFATVTWSSIVDDPPVLEGVDAYPDPGSIGDRWDDVASRLLAQVLR